MPVPPTPGVPCDAAQLTRRGFIAAGIAGGLTLAGCSGAKPQPPGAAAQMNAAIAAAEKARPHSGRTVTANLTPQVTEIDLGGPIARTLAFGNSIPGPVIRARVGDELVVTVSNKLDHPTSVHWHGIALRNDMDGAEPATPDIGAGQDFTYKFSVPNPGTYWAHPHTGLDEDTGLYLPVIIDDPTEGSYDTEWIVVLDDWTDGIGKSPQQLYEELVSPNKSGMPMPMPAATPTPPVSTSATSTTPTSTTSATSSTPTSSAAAPPPPPEAPRVGNSDLLGGDAGDIMYPYYLINGRIPAAPTTFNAKPGQRIRIRFINTGSDTAFRVALGGHSMTVTHTDGFPVVPTQVDALLIGMAERYDVIVTAADGVFPLVAVAEGKNALARALLSTGKGSAPDAQFQPPELTKRVGTIEMFTATTPVNLGRPEPNLDLPVVLGGNMMQYNWMINGEPYSKTNPLQIRLGQRPTLTFDNTTMMYHPIHLHGHTFQLIKSDGTPGARKDTVIVLPKQKLIAVLVADNPGQWQLHCHNTYHQVAGMMTRLDYVF
ncbi:Multicopper oxidase with three cupredoxin domains (includes cell division protein FtsP and spore coat protein CotA) [Mycobacterium rhizamassiliense]|jgi:FtsP/CotA-like multicopper oxidase with cupredoxin domain|uniref:Multicopper oxidase with three cupredoxin domains (Includes cell division protein FtsP and spore coat protein CotA) n=1 Tax=Mycobacterium rhizamassiliense TaxID=1841860 RepID=A0A2U3NSR6_9MYCO|nr:multicopper oxidase family protein [Mycobacterium rhizamassiliense]SPM34558.1 Multicopper oxidase with three cupredoxin domains (includes cell division protein FtsP and spore coat protein CotA) [Mycobacterium rhizamassiliense]